VSVVNLFLARGARKVAEPDSDDLEDQRLLLLDRSELEEALDRGEFKVATWAAIVALALRHLSRDHRL
jgi:ADP-ribose pyrophosphatase